MLRDDVKDLGRLANLAQLETRCCAFFRFTFEVTATNFVLVVRVPPGASSLLAAFLDEGCAGTVETVVHQFETPDVANSSASLREP